ncbi:hypothetical protein GL263_13540 [Streptomyces durbertensis]|uniref:Uncharacterized protein n=1 Tax=Streptomyces durbertensis TaxID=2448886 RepID=A0ABR6EGX5_9ACTN|nr:hypothetical protein [Streptomyces durbertensis]MBB1244581.1 hypothetical protein [Streptomyces durbertensis]
MSFGQGGPAWGPGGSGTPDWDALAANAAADRARRRRWLMIGGGALATAAVAAVVAVAVVAESGGRGDDSPSALPSPATIPPSPDQPEPTFNTKAPPPPPNPYEFISDPKKDTAPLTVKSLFPDKKIEPGGREYTRRATDSTKNCDAAAVGDLSAFLTANKCREVHRATYTGDGMLITLGVAVFDSVEVAKKVGDEAPTSIAPLPGEGVPVFCRSFACRAGSNSHGRYAYFTIAGYLNGKDTTAEDTRTRAAVQDIGGYAYQRIEQRGKDQALAAATAPPE